MLNLCKKWWIKQFAPMKGKKLFNRSYGNGKLDSRNYGMAIQLKLKEMKRSLLRPCYGMPGTPGVSRTAGTPGAPGICGIPSWQVLRGILAFILVSGVSGCGTQSSTSQPTSGTFS